jgi:TRAP-type C4-dicarboxylate transport system permease large subunit
MNEPPHEPPVNPFEAPALRSYEPIQAEVVAGAAELYRNLPLLRRGGVCTVIIAVHLGVLFTIPILAVFTSIGVIAVCLSVLTGPVYYKKLRKDGTLKRWSNANKVAAVILLLLFLAATAAAVYLVYGAVTKTN